VDICPLLPTEGEEGLTRWTSSVTCLEKIRLWWRFELRRERPKRDQWFLMGISSPSAAALVVISVFRSEVKTNVVIMLGSSP